ncbi:hypothetical protein ACU4GD_36735 [Cupriavidus basilensis]
MTLPRPERISSILTSSYDKLARIDGRNDNQVIFYDQIVPGSTLMGYVNADHWALAVPIARDAYHHRLDVRDAERLSARGADGSGAALCGEEDLAAPGPARARRYVTCDAMRHVSSKPDTAIPRGLQAGQRADRPGRAWDPGSRAGKLPTRMRRPRGAGRPGSRCGHPYRCR